MINQEEFLKIFKSTNFSEEKLVNFYNSIKKSVILFHVGRIARPQLLKLEKECQWPILCRIDDKKLDIYKGADPVLLTMFINSIRDEKEILFNKQKISRNDAWRIFNIVIEARVNIYKNIFGFTKKEVDWCKKVAERYKKALTRKKKSLLLKSGIGIAAMGAIGAGIYFFVKNKDNKK